MQTGKTRIFAGAAAALSTTGARLRGGLFRCQAADNTWESLTTGLPENVDVRAILVDPHNPDVIYAGTQDGPYRSRDGGDHWQKLDFPDQSAVIWALSMHPARPNVLYAGTAPIALYRSTDGGDSWHHLPNAKSPAHCERVGFDSRVLRITIDPSRPDDIYAALEVSGVIRSTDGGESWADMSAPLIAFAQQPHLQSNVGGTGNRVSGHPHGIVPQR
jgi:photosystem II stability/assembly factor-like uncharacterized protein